MLLPEHVARSKQADDAQRKMLAQHQAVRLQLAGSILGQLAAVEYSHARAQLREDLERDESRIDLNGADEPASADFHISMTLPIEVSLLAADGLLAKLGYIPSGTPTHERNGQA